LLKTAEYDLRGLPQGTWVAPRNYFYIKIKEFENKWSIPCLGGGNGSCL
jgi:hypothetical protein